MKARARLALADNHICRLIGAGDTLLHMGKFAEGSCCCGDDVDKHSTGSGHSPVDAGVYHANRVYEDAVSPARAYLDERYPLWHHPKRGTYYHVLASGIRFNCAGRLRDGEEAVLYMDTSTGKLSVRGAKEFLDGRFQMVEK